MAETQHRLIAILDEAPSISKSYTSLIYGLNEGRGTLYFDRGDALKGLARFAEAAFTALMEADKEKALAVLGNHATAAAVTDTLLDHCPALSLSEARESAGGRYVVVKVDPHFWRGRVL